MDHPEGARFCDACGGALARACPACQAPARDGARFCGQCGSPLATVAAAPAMAVPAAPVANPLGPGERKHVTILFADVRGSSELIRDLDPEEALALIDPVVQAAASAVARFGGIVNEVQGDGIMALFGAPLAAEDHPVRACLAAIALLRHLPPGIEIRVGVHSGEVVIRPTGHDATDYAAVGPAVHLAKRLEQAADPGTARISTETAQRTRGYTDVRPLGPVPVKGWDTPVPMFELLDATDRPSWEVRSAGSLSPFVGREPELATLSAALMRATLGRAQAVAVVADAGVGKSRLLHEFLQGAVARGVRVMRAAGAQHMHDAPFHAAAELMRSWIGAQPADDRQALERRLHQTVAMGDPLEVDEPAIRSLLDLPLAGPAAWQALDAGVRRQRLLDACRRVTLRGAAERARIVLVEDLHWLDEPSRALVDSLVATAGAARLLLLASARPEARPDWGGRSYGTELRLSPLDPEQSDALLCSLVGPGPELAALRARMVAGAEGTPLFLEEIARDLQENGTVGETPRRQWMQVALDQVSIPASVQAIVASRMDRLAAAPRVLLMLASVIGKDVRLEMLRRVTRLPEAELQSGLAALQAAEFLYETSPGTGTDYTFKHAVTQAVAYEAILRTERRALHGRVFQALQAMSGDRADEQTELLCKHAAMGGQWEQAARYGLLAGDRARARFAWPEAVRYYELALEGQSHVPETPEVLERGINLRIGLRAALSTIGEWRRGAEVLEDAREIAVRLGDELRAAQIDGMACTMLTTLGDLERAVELGRRGTPVAVRSAHVPTQQTLGFALGQAHWFRGEFADARKVLQVHIHHARGPLRTASVGSAGTPAVMSFVCLSKTHAMLGEFGPAHELAAEATALAAETGQPYDLGYAPIAAGFALMLQGRDAGAVAALEGALATVRKGGIMLLLPSIARYLGRSLAAVGQHEAAADLLTEALEATRRQNLVGLTAWCGAALAHVHLASGSPAADTVAADADRLAARHGYRPVQAVCVRLLAECQASRGDWAEAAEGFQVASAMLAEMGMRPERVRAGLGLARSLAALGQHAESADARAAAISEGAVIGLDPGVMTGFPGFVAEKD